MSHYIPCVVQDKSSSSSVAQRCQKVGHPWCKVSNNFSYVGCILQWWHFGYIRLIKCINLTCYFLSGYWKFLNYFCGLHYIFVGYQCSLIEKIVGGLKQHLSREEGYGPFCLEEALLKWWCWSRIWRIGRDYPCAQGGRTVWKFQAKTWGLAGKSPAIVNIMKMVCATVM